VANPRLLVERLKFSKYLVCSKAGTIALFLFGLGLLLLFPQGFLSHSLSLAGLQYDNCGGRGGEWEVRWWLVGAVDQ